MKLKAFMLFVLLTMIITANIARAEDSDSNIWLDAGLSYGGSASFNMSDGHDGWGLAYYQYLRSDLFTATYDKSTNRPVEPGISAVGINRIHHFPARYSTKTVSYGLAMAKIIETDNCVVKSVSWFFADEYCDIETTKTIAVPLHADIAWGRYVSLGFFAEILLTPKDVYPLVGISYQIGRFYSD